MNGVVQFIKEKYFGGIIRHETENYLYPRDFSPIHKRNDKTETPFLCRARKNKKFVYRQTALPNIKTNLNRRR